MGTNADAPVNSLRIVCVFGRRPLQRVKRRPAIRQAVFAAEFATQELAGPTDGGVAVVGIEHNPLAHGVDGQNAGNDRPKHERIGWLRPARIPVIRDHARPSYQRPQQLPKPRC